jgi:predicted DCC family thiol-disulfide oxidoreductase YuxK
MPREPYSFRSDPNVPPFADDRPILVFDGLCVLCSRTAQFIFAHDRRRNIRFIVAQSPLGAALYRHYGLRSGDFETNILIENGIALTKSNSSIRIFELMGWPWALAGMSRLIPLFVRDRLYELIARNRIKWFGARQTCHVPASSDLERFLG